MLVKLFEHVWNDKMRINKTLLLLLFSPLSMMAKNEVQIDSTTIVTNSFWDNWYGQVGVDMTLMNPYGANFTEVFPKGKAFGIDIGVGKWFTPEFGIRAKVNWENGIFKNDNAIWLEKADQTHGGWVSIIGDAIFNLHNLFGDYNPNMRWNLSVYPRMGDY